MPGDIKNTLICPFCGQEKPLNRFPKRSYTTASGEVRICYLSKCKDCKNEEARKDNPKTKEQRKITRAIYYQNNRGSVRAKGDEYYQENRESILVHQKEYQSLNKDKVKESKRKSEKRRMENDPSFKLRKRVSAQIRDHLIRFGSSKRGKSIVDFLDYSLEDLRCHLEAKFESWMNWNNYGPYDIKSWDDNNSKTWKWNIDHIVPQYKFPYLSMEDENFKRIWALENLRPYSAKQNLLDGANKIR